MAEKLKMLMDIFGKVTFGVLIAATVFISVFGGFDAQDRKSTRRTPVTT